MDKSDIINGLNQFAVVYDSQTYFGSYRETPRNSLLKPSTTRANTLWKMAEYVIATYDNTTTPISSYIDGWKNNALKANNQYLLLEEKSGVWKMYDAAGKELGGEDEIKKHFLGKLKLREPLLEKQLIYQNNVVKDFMARCVVEFLGYDKDLSKAKSKISVNQMTIGFSKCYFGKLTSAYDNDPTRSADYNTGIKWSHKGEEYYFYNEQRNENLEVFADEFNKIYKQTYHIEIDKNQHLYKLYKWNKLPLQKIFYGGPGTGKSYTINKKTQGHDVIRITFHPDSDYSTFVGAYKPQMGDSKPIYGFDSSGNTVKIVDYSKGKEITGQKIEYKFVKQAFLKAYIEAWKKIGSHASSTKSISFSVGTATYTILSVDDKSLQQSKTDQINKVIVERVWEKLWEGGSFVIPTGSISGESVQQAISKWIYDNIEDCKKDNFTEGWEKLTNKLEENEIEVKKDDTDRSKKYTLSSSENKDSVLFSAVSENTKDRIQRCYEGYDEANSVEKGIIDILNNYGVDDFDDAWKKLREAVENRNSIEDTVAPQFLIIEEINRGNCAQIFGDIFQLLDRQDNGFSEYPIEADSDLQKAIAEELQNENVYINVDWALANYKSTINGSTLSEDIKAGRILLLPNNFYIWATMNTSDQSLFPMDSAFKRRWDWECIPIDYNNEKSNKFTITVNGKKHNWHAFLKVVNKKILKATGSEDKQMGNFFIKGDVDEKQFVNKVMFYLWNDVCKEEYDTNNNFFRYYKDSEKKEEQFTFNKLFKDGGGIDTVTLDKFMLYLKVDEEEAKMKKSELKEVVEFNELEVVPEP